MKRSLLTPTEATIVRALALKGYDNARLAAYLGMSPATLRTHLANIFRSLSLHTRTEVADWAWITQFVTVKDAEA